MLCIVWIGGIGLDAEVDEVQRAGYFLPVWELVDSGIYDIILPIDPLL